MLFHFTACVILQASASVFVDPQDTIHFTKTGNLTGGNFIAADASPTTSSANTPYPSRPPSTLPSHSYTLHQVMLGTLMYRCPILNNASHAHFVYN
jgi:hypothetical protein